MKMLLLSVLRSFLVCAFLGATVRRIYVEKGGSDLNSGKRPHRPMLTFRAALRKAWGAARWWRSYRIVLMDETKHECGD